MTRLQRLGFFLTGIVFLLCGAAMTLLGFLHDSLPLQWGGPFFLVSGLFWLMTARFVRRGDGPG